MGFAVSGGSKLGATIETAEIADNQVTHAKLDTELQGIDGTKTFFPLYPDSVGQGTFAYTHDTTMTFNISFGNISNANGDNATYKLSLIKGTYTIDYRYLKASDQGIHKLEIDGVTVFDDVDSYGSGQNHVSETTSFAIATSGEHDLKITANGKNASSSAYGMRINSITFIRTGA